MPLPEIVTPTYTLTVPSTKKKLKYRPFLVKEQKPLIIALEAKDDVSDGALASDGFFPFDDTVKKAASFGIRAIIQPGGSIKDKDSIAACDELGLTMVLTGTRHFLH